MALRHFNFLHEVRPLFCVNVGLLFYGGTVTATADENECDEADDDAGLCSI